MPFATYVVQVDWLNNSGFTGSNDDISSYVMEAEWTRGRDYASMLVGRSVAGRLRLKLLNTDGRFSSFLTSGPLYGSLLPGRKVRVRAHSGNFPYDFPITFEQTWWQGFIDRLIPDPVTGQVKTATLEAIGALGYINQRRAELPMLTDIAAGSAVGTILDSVDWPSADRSIDTGQSTFGRVFIGPIYALEGLRKAEDSEDGFLWEDKTGRIMFMNRHGRLQGSYQTSQLTITDDSTGTGTVSVVSMMQEDPLPFVYNVLHATVQLYTTSATTTLWKSPATGTDSPLIAAGGSGTFWAAYPNPTATNNAVAVASWTTPTATTDYNVFTDSAGTGTNLNTAMLVTVTAFDNAMKIVIENTGTRNGYVTLLQGRGVPVLASDPVIVSREDATSQTAYGERSYSNPGPFVPSVAEAEGWADINLRRYKDAHPVVSVTIYANRDATSFNEAAVRDINDRVTLRATGSGSLGINEAFYIEAEYHQVNQERKHQVVWSLSPATALGDFWVLNTSELGSRTRLMY